MPVPSWNLAIAVIFVMGISFGYILQRDKIIATLLSVYVGLIMTQALSGTMQQFFEGSKTFNQFWINLHASPFSIRSAIFMLTITLLTAKAGISGGKTKGLLSPFEIIGYSILTTGLILSSLFNFMPADSRAAFVENSKFAAILINDYTWWVITPVLVLIGMGFFRKSAD
ncbi:TPA: hypothetical protein DD449_05050 [Candidatus Berkelbacteria bacterium]|uniref:Uncharacterized protein n=1 Tax=Berkelbacteria bacterium GW2011_GWE1_39_12 TaxID=1618337 RepID=A0A0G4B3K6_9BACT|nr:MAG: hypothetical protein UT28_C0001G0629 [Berkelbacteria bacterium GW2011_GWE1_39_12]HBO61020.1 hypothetical protein [Candidatus Berkelbacteria bacterium]